MYKYKPSHRISCQIIIGLFWAVFLPTLMLSPALASPFPFRDCHLEVYPAKQFYGKLTTNLTTRQDFYAGEWIIFLSYPPELDSQKNVAAKLSCPDSDIECTAVQELSDQKRPLLRLKIPAGVKFTHNMPLQGEFWATLNVKRLVDGKPTKPVPNLPTDTINNYLTDTTSLDFKTNEFQDFLDTNNLRINPGERDIDFAWRVFELIRDKYSYSWYEGMQRNISSTCKSRSSDCGGLSYLVVGTLRANAIPARVLIGRWAETGDKPEIAGTYGKCHVICEFFAKGIGWVPIDMARAVSNKNANPLKFFGLINGKFFTVQLNPDLIIDTLAFGPKPMRSMQDFRYWVVANSPLPRIPRNINWQVITQEPQ